MTRWILVRHGESTANADRVLAGHLDVPLTAKGRAQALALVAELADARISRVLASDLVRATETARLALTGRAWGLATHRRLRERHLGDWTGLPLADAEATGAKARLEHLRGRPPGGESLADVAARAMACLDAWDDGAPTLVVAHGGLIRAIWALHRGDVPEREVGRLPMPNARPLVLELPRGRWGALARALGEAK